MGRRDEERRDAGKSVSRRGREIYESSIRSRVEPEHDGRFLALDVSSGDYEVGDEVLPTSARLKERNPEAEIYLLRVGRRAAFRLGGRSPASRGDSWRIVTMVGAVTDDGGEPRLALSLVGGPHAGEASQRRIEAVIDTGFNGELTLPSGEIGRLGYPRVGTVDAELADGTTVETDYFAGRLVWHGEVREANVLSAEGAPLVGMGLLSGSRLTVDAAPGGAVGIEEMVG